MVILYFAVPVVVSRVRTGAIIERNGSNKWRSRNPLIHIWSVAVAYEVRYLHASGTKAGFCGGGMDER
jgi:hypothetical protein